MYEQREKPKEKIKASNRLAPGPVVINRRRHFNDYDEVREGFLGRPANGLLQRQKGRVSPIVRDYFQPHSSTIQRAVMAVTATEMLALASRLVAGLAAGVTLTKSLQELNKSSEFERMTSVQKMMVYAVLYKVANKAKPNKTETLPAEFDAHSTTGGSEITEQGVTSTSHPLTDQAILDLLGPIPASDDMALVGNTPLPIVDDLGLGRVDSQGLRNESVLKAESKALDDSAETVVSSSSQDVVGNATTMQVDNVVPNRGVGDVYDPNFVGPVQWEYFYRGDATQRSSFLSSMSQQQGVRSTDGFLDNLSSGAQTDILAEHGVSSAVSPFIGTSKNRVVAEYFAKGPNQTQDGFVSTFRVEAREAKLLQDQGQIVPNFENPMSFFEPNPKIGVPESEFLFRNFIGTRYLFQQTPVKAN